ncbi:zinc ribbon domain-containing protein [Thalassospira sp. CH_XMU1448-2]|uniref:zinc ribbon domain-containing protein n=1 Tax=Thalassospira sp. CH_XMU1448-2 TaxID=3107773 RepID=UPI00300BD343
MSDDQQRCCACGNEIVPDYKICAHCGTHQNPVRRRIEQILKTFAAVSIVAGAVSVTISFYPQVKKTLWFKEDVELVSVDTTVAGTPGTLSFLNKGDGDVFISELIIRLKEQNLPLEIRLRIHQLLKKDELTALRVATPEVSGDKFSDTVGPKQFDAWLASRTQQQIDDQINRCFVMKPFDETKGGYIVARKIASHPAVGVIRYYSPENRAVREVVSATPLKAALFRRNLKVCATGD